MLLFGLPLHLLAFLSGFLLVVLTLFSALSTFVLPRAARSRLNRVVFISLRRGINLIMHFAKTYRQRDSIMAYYAPIGLLLLVPTWYALILLGYAGMYWALGVGSPFAVFHLSGSSLFTLGLDSSPAFWVSLLVFSEAMLGLLLVALLIAYLPTMYSAFSRREQAVNMLGVRAGSPPSALEMLKRFYRIHGLEKLADYWRNWEAWFADIEESHTTLPALTFFRSPRPEDFLDHRRRYRAGCGLPDPFFPRDTPRSQRRSVHPGRLPGLAPDCKLLFSLQSPGTSFSRKLDQRHPPGIRDCPRTIIRGWLAGQIRP